MDVAAVRGSRVNDPSSLDRVNVSRSVAAAPSTWTAPSGSAVNVISASTTGAPLSVTTLPRARFAAVRCISLGTVGTSEIAALGALSASRETSSVVNAVLRAPDRVPRHAKNNAAHAATSAMPIQIVRPREAVMGSRQLLLAVRVGLTRGRSHAGRHSDPADAALWSDRRRQEGRDDECEQPTTSRARTKFSETHVPTS
ncbi:MAG: hypothetical protein L6Q99_06900 [Planctomycetes bacterium]|nr:hypothetical protein [Planctomycetota bacterium]